MQLFSTLTSKKALSIVAALSVSGGMIAVAYFFSGPNFFSIPGANAEDSRKLLEAYAAKDSDSDGLPDWQEALYATNPQDAHSVDSALTDGEAVKQGLVKPKFESAPVATSTPIDVNSIPGVTASSTTLTDQFARELFTQYIQNQTAGQVQTTPDQVASFVTGAVGQLNTMYVQPTNYRLSDILVSGTGTAALTTYAQTAEPLFFKNTPGTTKDETSYFYDAVTKDDTEAVKNVAKIGAWYTKTGKAYAHIVVPKEMAQAHLRAANSLIQIGSVTTDMATINSDPLRALLAVGYYDAALTEMLAAFADVHTVLVSGGATFATGDSGFLFASMVDRQQ